MLRYALQGNFAAPLGNPAAILDVACGTERWAIEMTALFPQATIVGTDITSPAETPGAPRPANFTFIQSNMLEGIPFPENSFDFTHQRLVIVALPTDRWVNQARELLRVTRPGGWIELVEGDLLPGGPGLTRLNALGEQMSQKREMSFTNANRVDEALRQAGARNVERRLVRIPVGQRAGRLGAMVKTDYLAILTSVRGFLLSQGIITKREHNQAIAQARAELASGRLTWPFYIAFGQK